MSCNYCGESYGVKLYYCEECDNDICEDCAEVNVEGYCDSIDCEYKDDCKIYKIGQKG